MFRKAVSGLGTVVALGCLGLACQKPEEAPPKSVDPAKPKLARASKPTVMSRGPVSKPAATVAAAQTTATPTNPRKAVEKGAEPVAQSDLEQVVPGSPGAKSAAAAASTSGSNVGKPGNTRNAADAAKATEAAEATETPEATPSLLEPPVEQATLAKTATTELEQPALGTAGTKAGLAPTPPAQRGSTGNPGNSGNAVQAVAAVKAAKGPAATGASAETPAEQIDRKLGRIIKTGAIPK